MRRTVAVVWIAGVAAACGGGSGGQRSEGGGGRGDVGNGGIAGVGGMSRVGGMSGAGGSQAGSAGAPSMPSAGASGGGGNDTPASGKDGGAPPSDAAVARTDAAADGWTPAALPGLVLWLDATVGVTASGGRVSKWTDRSGAHNDAAQPMAALQPMLMNTAGHAAIHFERARSSNLAITDAASLNWGTGDFFVAVITRHRSPIGPGHNGGLAMLYSKHATGPGTPEISLAINWPTSESTPDGTTVAVTVQEGLTLVSPMDGYNDDHVYLQAGRRTGRSVELRVDGAAVVRRDVGPQNIDATGNPAYLGKSAFGFALEGDLFEVVAIRGTASDADVQKLEAYLMHKYEVAGQRRDR